MKRWLCLPLALCMMACLFSGCKFGKDVITLNVYNWGEYISDGSDDLMDVNAQFEKEYGIRINYKTYESNESMYTLLESGAAEYDIVIPSDYMIGKMIEEDMLAKLNFDNIPNYQYIDEQYKGLAYDPNNEYSVPYTWGTMGLLYNTETVLEAPTSWDILLDETYKMDLFMLNAPRDTTAIALVMSGHDLNSTDPNDLADAKKLLIDQKPLVLAYVVDEVKDKMISGEASVALVWSGDATFCMSESESRIFLLGK